MFDDIDVVINQSSQIIEHRPVTPEFYANYQPYIFQLNVCSNVATDTGDNAETEDNFSTQKLIERSEAVTGASGLAKFKQIFTGNSWAVGASSSSPLLSPPSSPSLPSPFNINQNTIDSDTNETLGGFETRSDISPELDISQLFEWPNKAPTVNADHRFAGNDDDAIDITDRMYDDDTYETKRYYDDLKGLSQNQPQEYELSQKQHQALSEFSIFYDKFIWQSGRVRSQCANDGYEKYSNNSDENIEPFDNELSGKMVMEMGPNHMLTESYEMSLSSDLMDFDDVQMDDKRNSNEQVSDIISISDSLSVPTTIPATIQYQIDRRASAKFISEKPKIERCFKSTTTQSDKCIDISDFAVNTNAKTADVMQNKNDSIDVGIVNNPILSRTKCDKSTNTTTQLFEFGTEMCARCCQKSMLVTTAAATAVTATAAADGAMGMAMITDSNEITAMAAVAGQTKVPAPAIPPPKKKFPVIKACLKSKPKVQKKIKTQRRLPRSDHIPSLLSTTSSISYPYNDVRKKSCVVTNSNSNESAQLQGFTASALPNVEHSSDGINLDLLRLMNGNNVHADDIELNTSAVVAVQVAASVSDIFKESINDTRSVGHMADIINNFEKSVSKENETQEKITIETPTALAKILSDIFKMTPEQKQNNVNNAVQLDVGEGSTIEPSQQVDKHLNFPWRLRRNVDGDVNTDKGDKIANKTTTIPSVMKDGEEDIFKSIPTPQKRADNVDVAHPMVSSSVPLGKADTNEKHIFKSKSPERVDNLVISPPPTTTDNQISTITNVPQPPVTVQIVSHSILTCASVTYPYDDLVSDENNNRNTTASKPQFKAKNVPINALLGQHNRDNQRNQPAQHEAIQPANKTINHNRNGNNRSGTIVKHTPHSLFKFVMPNSNYYIEPTPFKSADRYERLNVTAAGGGTSDAGSYTNAPKLNMNRPTRRIGLSKKGSRFI